MSRWRRWFNWLGALALGLMGCTGPETNLKPNIPPQYRLPPPDDPRYSSPPVYPKETLDYGRFEKNQGRPKDDSLRDPRMGGSGFGPPGGFR